MTTDYHSNKGTMITDITFCINKQCAVREDCLRGQWEHAPKMASWAMFDDTDCDAFIPNPKETTCEASHRVYIAGPMRGYPNNNVAAFYAAEGVLTSLGFDVVNPARVDMELGYDMKRTVTADELREIAQRDIELLLGCDYIFLLDGWSGSLGARAESAVAEWAGIERLRIGQ